MVEKVGHLATDQWHKVDAHVEVASEPRTEEEIDTWLNDKADTKAKDAILLHGLGECAEQDYKTAATRAQDLLAEAAHNLAEHPPPKEQGIEYHRVPKQGGRLVAKVRHPHQWYRTQRQTWRCRKCWREKRLADSQQDFEPCGDVAGTIKQLGICAPFHRLSAAVIDGGPEMIIWCRSCGGYAETKACKLAGPQCKATSWTQRSLRALAQGFHPSRSAIISDIWDLTDAKGTQHPGEQAAVWAEPSQSGHHDGADTGSAGAPSIDYVDHSRVVPCCHETNGLGADNLVHDS